MRTSSVPTRTLVDATGTNWQVDIEESETVPGYYRILPYYEGRHNNSRAQLGGRLELHLYRRNPTRRRWWPMTLLHGLFPYEPYRA